MQCCLDLLALARDVSITENPNAQPLPLLANILSSLQEKSTNTYAELSVQQVIAVVPADRERTSVLRDRDSHSQRTFL